MKTQNQCLFEVPFASEVTHYTNAYFNSDPLNEEDWEQSSSFSSHQPIIRETVSGFPRYSNLVRALPPKEQQKINEIARLIVNSYGLGQQPIRTVRLIGHADKDTPRRPDFEKKISGDRALAVKKALMSSINQQHPGLATKIIWQFTRAGATQLIVLNPVTEKERLRNRRVEIWLGTRSKGGTVDPNDPPGIRQIQSCLNRILGTQLVTDGIMGLKTHTAIRNFQKRQGLPVSGMLTPETVTALTLSCGSPPINKCTISPSNAVITKPSKLPRTCCILAPSVLTRLRSIADPSKLGKHGTNTEEVGIIYTGKAGFIDLGHLRDLCDLTKFVFDQIKASGVTPSSIQTTNGEATFLSCPVDIITIAQAISLDDGIGHEIFSYDYPLPGYHNSSFSPEDLCSNFLGTLVARRAITAGGSFNDAVTTELNNLLRALDTQPRKETRKAFDLIIKRGWIEFADPVSPAVPRYLLRRNFSQIPWKAGHPSDSPTPTFVITPLPNMSSVYTYVHKEKLETPLYTSVQYIDKSTFASRISAIKANAAKKYGPNFDKP